MKAKQSVFPNPQRLPLGIVFLIDFLIFAAFFGIFMLVHYVGSQLRGDPIVQGEFTNPYRDGDEQPDDFGARFPDRFSEAGVRDIFVPDDPADTDSRIRAYLSGMGSEIYDANGEGKFIGLYRSHDVYLSVLQVDTVMAALSGGDLHKERYYVYDVYVRNIENLYTYATGRRGSMEKLVDRAAGLKFTDGLPVAAVNGDYWGNTSHCLLCVRNGLILGADPHYDYIYSDLCVLYYDGTMETFRPDEFDWKTIREKVPYQIWNFGPGLLDENGVSYGSYSNDSYDHNVVDARHPRTIFGYYEPGHYCFVVIDGRSDASDGMTLPEAALILQDLGCKQAYNMDGGDSTYAYFGGSIVRQNWGRAEDDNARRIYDIICVGETQSAKKGRS